MNPPDSLLIAVVVGGLLVNFSVFLVVFALRYVRVGPNEALIVFGRQTRVPDLSGRSKVVGFRIVAGGGTFVWPVVEKAARLSLEIQELHLSARERGGSAEAGARIKIKGDPASIRAAAERFLSKAPSEVGTVCAELIGKRFRDALGAGAPDRAALERQVSEAAAGDLAPLGVELVSFTVKEMRHGVGPG